MIHHVTHSADCDWTLVKGGMFSAARILVSPHPQAPRTTRIGNRMLWEATSSVDIRGTAGVNTLFWDYNVIEGIVGVVVFPSRDAAPIPYLWRTDSKYELRPIQRDLGHPGIQIRL